MVHGVNFCVKGIEKPIMSLTGMSASFLPEVGDVVYLDDYKSINKFRILGRTFVYRRDSVTALYDVEQVKQI